MRYLIYTLIVLLMCMGESDAQAGKDLLAFRSPAPPFSLGTTSGRQITLSDFKGKMVVIYCWDNEDKNSHVLDTMQRVVKEYQEDTSIVFLAVTTQPIAPGVFPNKSRLLNVKITEALKNSFFKDYGVAQLPKTIMIGRHADILTTGLPEGMFAIFLKLMSQIEESADEANHPPYWDYKARIGDLVPGDIKLKVVDGKTYTMSQLRGQVVLLEFTASWCGVCRELMPHLEKDIWQAFKSKGLKVFGVDLKEPPATIRKLASATGITYPLVQDEDGKIFYHFVRDIGSVTKVMLIDKSGHIVYLSSNKMDQAEQATLRDKIATML
ncbi:peroxiredoxin [Chitinophaga dinghuensis]|uniref:Peroxiredoxin n=1 Tax=Chitinophaga dinghuensis TaxID=1539050 RepID=A0A327W1M1_9BACT|nr:TlpA family protein disulfide reductase [Chitinophaga dinghuensis]RAJ83187.1 peroxiredoxin [Chitinophaga dinghuensis]